MADDDILVVTRRALHALAERVLAPLRAQLTGHEIALQVRPGGFGTPALPGGGWAGVGASDVVRAAADGTERRAPITSLRAAGVHVGLTGATALPDAPLAVDPAAAARVAAAHALGEQALATLAAGADPDEQASAVVLWPEHFDIAIELGSPGARANYGVSPGDDTHPEPYAYVGPWAPPAPGPLWQAAGFPGAELRLGDAGADAVLEFWRERRAALRGR